MTKSLIKIGPVTVDVADYELPEDRNFREAWVFSEDKSSAKIEIDMKKAREVWRDKIRTARESAFTELDSKFMKALETGADTTEIVKQKNALRNAPSDPAIDAAKTPEDLLKIQPAGLKIK